MDWTPRASNWHSADDVFGRVNNGPQEYLRTLQGYRAKSILMSKILNVIQDFQEEELPQKNAKNTKEYSERNGIQSIQSLLCFLRFFAAIAFERAASIGLGGPGDAPHICWRIGGSPPYNHI